MIIKIFENLGRNASITISFGLILGLTLQPLATQAKPLLLPSVWCILAFSIYRLDYAAFVDFFKNRAKLALLIAWLLLICPILVWCIAYSLPIRNSTLIALVMTAGSSPLIGAAAIGRLLRLNNEMILALLVCSTILTPITLPFIALQFLKLEIGVSAGELILRLGMLIGSAGLAALILRNLNKNQNKALSEHTLDGITVILFWLCGVPLMDGVTEQFFRDPTYTLFLIFLSFSVYIGLMLIGTFLAYLIWQNWKNAVSIGLTTGCRNLAIIIVVLPENVNAEIILYFALAQFPIYLMPAILKFVGTRNLKSL